MEKLDQEHIWENKSSKSSLSRYTLKYCSGGSDALSIKMCWLKVRKTSIVAACNNAVTKKCIPPMCSGFTCCSVSSED